MNKDLIDFYEEQKIKIQREIDDLREVNKRSPKRENRLIEIEYILKGLEANKIINNLIEENRALRARLMKEGIDIDE